MAALRMNGGEEKEEKAMEFTGKQIQEARERIAPFVDETPLLRLKALDAYLGCQVYVKAECMQKTGAFKFRGAMNRILTLTDEELSRGSWRHLRGTTDGPSLMVPEGRGQGGDRNAADGSGG